MRLPLASYGLVTAAALLLGGGAHANIVSNAGFETGDFTGWTQTGDTTFNGVQCPGAGFVQSGNCDAFFGPVGTLGGITQNLSTVAGTFYDISFWLDPDGANPSQFIFNWDGGAAELSLSNMPDTGFVEYNFHLLASSATTSLSFSFRDDAGFIFLDTVTVNAATTSVPEPTTLALAGLAILGLAVTRRRRQ